MWDFELVSIEKTTPPVAESGGNWYRYTIANKITSVDGCRRGSKAEVSRFVKGTIERLNVRHLQATTRQSISL